MPTTERSPSTEIFETRVTQTGSLFGFSLMVVIPELSFCWYFFICFIFSSEDANDREDTVMNKQKRPFEMAHGRLHRYEQALNRETVDSMVCAGGCRPLPLHPAANHPHGSNFVQSD
jgi:hypothetical protein